MNKYIKTGFFLATLTLGLIACDRDALDVNPEDQLSTATFWKTESDALAGLAACYSTLKLGESDWSMIPSGLRFPTGMDALSDDGYAQYDGGAANTISFSGPTPNTGGFVYNFYFYDYRAIAIFNNFLANIGKVTMDEATRKVYIAEVKFLRAYHYFELANLYGNIILVKEPATDSYKEPQTKSSRDEVLAFVNEDLDAAVSDLPDKAYTDGHVVKGTAQAMKARVLLYQKKYAEAAALAKTVTSGGKFSLAPSYSSLFAKPGQNNNPEILFSVRQSSPNSYPMYGVDLAQGSWLSAQPTQDLVNEYEAKDGLPTSSSPLYDPAKPYENRDPRLRMTVFVPGDGPAQGWNQYNSGSPTFVPFAGSNTTGFAAKKYLDLTKTNPQYGTISDQDYVLIRYAEVLLNYAEAENEANGPANAYAAVNQVRARVGMPALTAGLTQAQMRDKIRHETRVEFGLEGLRYYNLRRWGIAAQKLNNFVIVPGNTNLKNKIYQPTFDYWPIPQTDIDRNPALVQNTGY